MCPSFTKKGKEWKRKGDLINHIHITDCSKYINCVVVEYEISYAEKQTTDLAGIIRLSEERSQASALERKRKP